MSLKMCDAVRLVLTTQLSDRDIARSLSLSKTTVHRYRIIAFNADWRWEDLRALSPDKLRLRFNRSRRGLSTHHLPDFAALQAELESDRDKLLTLRFLWEKYRADMCALGLNGLSYSQYTHHFRKHAARTKFSMRQRHVAGEAAFVDFSGKRPFYLDRTTGTPIPVELFVSVLGASSYTYATCVPTQRIADWIHANRSMLEFFGGAPQKLVPDNLKSAVIKAGREPTLQRNYEEFARYYEVAIVPARPRMPKDKGSVENAVKLIQRWLIPRLKPETFYSIDELNAAVAKWLALYNEKPMRRHAGLSRRQRFETIDKPVLRPLPPQPFSHAEWLGPQSIPKDYLVSVRGHDYSVPHELVSQKVEARIVRDTVEFYVNHALVASHTRSDIVGGFTMKPEHQPPAHRGYAGHTPEAMRTWAKRVGPSTAKLVDAQFERRHPSLGLPVCSSFKRLAEQHGERVFEAAAARALFLKTSTLTNIKAILRNGLHENPSALAPPPTHTNLRGATYYTGRTSC